ncbi:MAG: 1-aminocyclopropane-1-carboxylate deaminase/D-cysteine desulfhydrase [Saprospiraceae bacterium]
MIVYKFKLFIINKQLSIDFLDEQLPSPIEVLEVAALEEKGIRLLIKRDDLLRINEHSAFCGNKWRKLKYNLYEAHRRGLSTLLTFGGAFSNHLAAVAEAGQLFGFQTIGVVRGEEILPLNPTLQFCRACGMHLHYLDRTAYRQKNEPAFAEWLTQAFGTFYFIPEGGTNNLALRGCAEMVPEIQQQLNGELPDYLAVACGTGGTLAGIISGLEGKSQAIGFSVLKGDFLQYDIAQLLQHNTDKPLTNWQIQTDYHFGGYAKFRPELIQFINNFKEKYHIILDPIYTGKLLYGLFDLVQKDFFPPDSTVLAVHTGGLQGIAGFNARFGNLII